MDQPVSAPHVYDLAITGMTCASCVSRVEKTLARVPGVSSVAVNLAAETAHVLTNGAPALPSLLAAVERAGYQASLRASTPTQSDSPTKKHEVKLLIISACLSAPLLLGMVLPVPGWVEWLLATPVQFWLGGRFYIAGFKALRAGTGNMDLLVALGTSAAYFLSVYNLLAQHGPLYFESAAMLVTVIRLGKYLELRAKARAVQAVSGLTRLRPAVAHSASGGDVPVASLRPGDIVELRPGERVPADGVLLPGAGGFDESLITGESLPVLKDTGALVMAGTLNLDSVLHMRVTSGPGETLLERMARLIDEAQSSRPRAQKLADRIAAIFVPVVLLLALLTLGGWMWAGAGLSTALINAVAVMVIACPCALGLATPAALLAGTGTAARHGILIRNADALERASRLSLIMFDKTGTLTQGKPKLAGMQTFGIPAEAAKSIAAALAASDTHPLAQALRAPNAPPARGVRAIAGRGTMGTVEDSRYILGSERMIEDAGGVIPTLRLPSAASFSFLATGGGNVLAAFAFTDTAHESAKQAIVKLRGMGLAVAMLSGDRREAAETMARELGIESVTAELSPAQKLDAIALARASGQVVAMVGDGINDAPALAAADLGIAIGTGADAAIEAADLSLLRADPLLVPAALDFACQINKILRQGLFWAFIYNLVGIPLAAFGLLSPMIAGAAMAASSVCVLLNALRLTKWHPA